MEATLLLMQETEDSAPTAGHFLTIRCKTWTRSLTLGGKYSLLSQHFIFKLCHAAVSVTHQFGAQQSVTATFGWTDSTWPRWHWTGLIAAECWHTVFQRNFEVCRLTGQVGIRISSSGQHSGSRWAAVKPRNQPKCPSDDSAFPFISLSKSCQLLCRTIWEWWISELSGFWCKQVRLIVAD